MRSRSGFSAHRARCSRSVGVNVRRWTRRPREMTIPGSASATAWATSPAGDGGPSPLTLSIGSGKRIPNWRRRRSLSALAFQLDSRLINSSSRPARSPAAPGPRMLVVVEGHHQLHERDVHGYRLPVLEVAIAVGAGLLTAGERDLEDAREAAPDVEALDAMPLSADRRQGNALSSKRQVELPRHVRHHGAVGGLQDDLAVGRAGPIDAAQDRRRLDADRAAELGRAQDPAGEAVLATLEHRIG